MLSNILSLLYLGRALAGVSTTLLYTSFETWMISEYHRLGFAHTDGALNSVFGKMSILNGFVAVTCGIICQYLVYFFESEKAPFLASIVCLILASMLILRSWVTLFHGQHRTEIMLTLKLGRELR